MFLINYYWSMSLPGYWKINSLGVFLFFIVKLIQQPQSKTRVGYFDENALSVDAYLIRVLLNLVMWQLSELAYIELWDSEEHYTKYIVTLLFCCVHVLKWKKSSDIKHQGCWNSNMCVMNWLFKVSKKRYHVSNN